MSFDLSTVFRTVAEALPDQQILIWRDQRLTYAQMDARIDGVAHYLVAQGLGCHTERDQLENHQSGQDHVGLYLRNGNAYLEAMVAGYRARVAPFNVNYRYVEEELLYLLADSKARALVYAAEFAPHVQSIRGRLPDLQVLIQVADDSGNEPLRYPGGQRSVTRRVEERVAIDARPIIHAQRPKTQVLDSSAAAFEELAERTSLGCHVKRGR